MKRTNKNKMTHIGLVLVMTLAMMLVGCGDKKKEDATTSEEPTTTIEATTSEEPTTQEATTSEEPTTSEEVEDDIEVGLWEYNGVETYYYHSWDETYGEYAHISLPYWGIEMDMSKGLFGDPNEFVVWEDQDDWDYWTTFCENVQAHKTTGAPSLHLHSITNGYVFIRECSGNFEGLSMDDVRLGVETDPKDGLVYTLSELIGLQVDATNCEYDEVVVEEDGTISRTIEIESTFGLVEGDKQYGYMRFVVTPDDHFFVIVLVDTKEVNANTMRDTLYFINTFIYNPDHATHQATGNWEE